MVSVEILINIPNIDQQMDQQHQYFNNLKMLSNKFNISTISSEIWARAYIHTRNQNLGRTPLESTLKIIRVRIKNFPLKRFENPKSVKRVPPTAAGGWIIRNAHPSEYGGYSLLYQSELSVDLTTYKQTSILVRVGRISVCISFLPSILNNKAFILEML